MKLQQIRQDHQQAATSREAGFSLLELMVVSVILLATVIVGYPAIEGLLHRQRMLSYTQEVSIALARARHEAIRRGVPVVVSPRFVQGDVFAFANVDLDPAQSFDPDITQPQGTVDYPILSVPVPGRGGVKFRGRADGTWDGAEEVWDLGPEPPGDAINGLTAIDRLPASPDNNPPFGVVFEQDGSVRDVGAIRISDRRGNFMEVRVGPAATGRVRILKWNEDPAWGGPAGYFENDHDPITGKAFWVWY